ncbi:hypothetical protein BaRGS_00036399 [Batillaria attramentaria]|uniref:G-protein coupled receptors family 1 profile domain-containing protein n=1 Tax=Batillaria attramentaria TaxID=370345 RepID=A0ABD0JBZ1_9CAEN
MFADNTSSATDASGWNTRMDTLLNVNKTGASNPQGCLVLQPNKPNFLPWDNPDNLVSLEVVETFDIIAYVVCLSLFLVGAPTNIISLIAFYRQGVKQRINLCLFSQSFADLCNMTTNFLLYADQIYPTVSNTSAPRPVLRFVINNYLIGLCSFHWVSGFITMLIACERCFCVVSPLRSSTVLRTRTMAVIIVTASLLIVGGYFVNAARWRVTCVFDRGTNTTSDQTLENDLNVQTKRLVTMLDGVVYGLLLPAVFVLAVLVSTILTVTKIKRMTSWRERTSSVVTTPHDVSLTRTLIGTSVLFIVCTVPNIALRIGIMFVPQVSMGGRYHNTLSFMGYLTQLFSSINSSANFFIYYSMGSKYRKTVKSMFGRASTTRNTADPSRIQL